jgi:TolA-binding protein
LEYYIKASTQNVNELTTPRYLFKAGQTALMLGNKADALKYFTEIKEKYESTPEAQNIDALIGMAQ